MSHSKYEYVRKYECDDRLLPECWIVVRIDGKAFHKFSEQHHFVKPNDKPALDLMTGCAKAVMSEFTDVILAYGQSDEFSFVLRKDTGLYSRRASKISTNVVSLFAAAYVHLWPQFMNSQRTIQTLPSFDARVVLYPTEATLRDYLSWRQVDCHVNNLYNTVFWALVQRSHLSCQQAQERLKGTLSSEKNEILFSQFDINYNNEPQQFRKGTVLWRKRVARPLNGAQPAAIKVRTQIEQDYCDIIGDKFWNDNPDILSLGICEQ